jgi:hypothetical protein
LKRAGQELTSKGGSVAMKTEDLKPGQLVQHGRGQLLRVLDVDEDYIKTVRFREAGRLRLLGLLDHRHASSELG